MVQNDIEYIKNNLQKEDLSVMQQELLDCLGMESYMKLCDSFGGSNITVTTMETLRKSISKRKILEDRILYESGVLSLHQLAKTHNVCSSTAYKILKEER